ncbi:MAG: outer membrane beta-barrel protein [Sandaracinobacteroides sp.]
MATGSGRLMHWHRQTGCVGPARAQRGIGAQGLLLGGFLAGLCAAQPALAQLPPPQQRIVTNPGAVIDNPYRVFGDDAPTFSPLSFIGALGFSASGNLDVEYNDNVARQDDGEPLPPRFSSKDDWIFRPSLSLSAEYPVGRQRLFGNANVGRTIYSRNSNLNSNTFGFGGGADLAIGSRCGGNVRLGFSKRDTQLGTFEDVVPSTQARSTLGLSATCRSAVGLSATVGYNRGKIRNDSFDPARNREFADVDSQSVNGNIGYAVGSRGQVGFNALWSENIYPKQLLFTGENNQNEIRSLGIFGAYRIGNSLRANASYGQTEVSSNTPGSTAFKGSTWSLGLGYSGPRLGANLATGRSVSGAAGGSSNYSIRKFATFSTTYRLRDNISASAGYSHDDSDQRGIGQVPDTEVVQSTVSDRVFFGMDYRLNQILSFSADLNHLRRSSNPAQFGYKVNSVSVTARAKF